MANHLFVLKMGLFAAVIALEIWPMLLLMRWRGALRRGGQPATFVTPGRREAHRDDQSHRGPDRRGDDLCGGGDGPRLRSDLADSKFAAVNFTYARVARHRGLLRAGVAASSDGLGLRCRGNLDCEVQYCRDETSHR